MSMMEIYNEAVYDLLGADKDSKKSLEIRQKAGGGTGVPGVEEVGNTLMSVESNGTVQSVATDVLHEHSVRKLVFGDGFLFDVRV